MTKWFIRKHLSDPDLRRITEAITRAERETTGEIRVAIHQHRHWRERKLSLHELAVREFHRLEMQKTADRTGILLLLLLSERRFHIVADEGIHKRVGNETWERIVGSMSTHFRSGNFCDGIVAGVESVGHVLSEHFPRAGKKTNELDDGVVVD